MRGADPHEHRPSIDVGERRTVAAASTRLCLVTRRA